MKRLFQALLLTVLFINSANPILGFVESRGSLLIESRQFKDDSLDNTYDSTFTLSSELELTAEHEGLATEIRMVGRSDSLDSSRNTILFQDAWVGYFDFNWELRLGAQTINWTALEAFHPVDILNSRNFDGNPENPEKIGEPMLKFDYLLDLGTFSLFLMPTQIAPRFPGPNNRLSASVGQQAAPVKWSREDTLQWATRWEQTLGDADVSVHYISHMDRSQPVFANSATTGQLHPVFLQVNQVGGTLQYILDAWIIKAEVAYRNFIDHTNTEFGTLTQVDHTQYALGLEYGVAHESGSESTFLLEGQHYGSTTEAQRQKLGFFQHDILLGYRYAFNDVEGSEWMNILIYDLERSGEYILSTSFSRRLTDIWKVSVGAKLVQSNPDANQSIGLGNLRYSDHIFLNLTRYF